MSNNFLNPIIDNSENINPVNRELIAEYATLPLLFPFARLDRSIGANDIVSSFSVNSIFSQILRYLISIFIDIVVLPGYIMESNLYYIE
jgi:hypothetical protein